MAKYILRLDGEAEDADDIREIFESTTRQLRLEGPVAGELKLDGVPYLADDVSNEAPGDDADEAPPSEEVEAVSPV